MKCLFLSTATATTKDLTTGSARWALSEPLRFAESKNQGAVQSWPPTTVAQGGRYPEVAVHQFSYVNWFINISAALNNNVFYFSDDALDDTKYTITIPDGSYDIVSLNTFVVAAQLASGAAVHVFNLNPNYSTNRVVIEFLLANWYVNIPPTDIVTLLGFPTAYYPADQASDIGETIEATNVAVFNNIQTVNISSNLTNNALAGTSLRQSNIIFSSVPSSPVGYAVNDTPPNLLWIVSELLTGSVSEIALQLVDQTGTPINTSDEEYSLTLLIKY